MMEKKTNKRTKLFFDTVKLMRENQRSYYSTRSKEYLERSKRAEGWIDSEIAKADYIVHAFNIGKTIDINSLKKLYMSQKFETIEQVKEYIESGKEPIW